MDEARRFAPVWIDKRHHRTVAGVEKVLRQGFVAMRERESEVRHIYVALLGQGNDAWRQVEAVSVGEDAYRIVSTNEHPEERWEYGTGDTVRCRGGTLPGGERVLFATERLHSEGKGGASGP